MSYVMESRMRAVRVWAGRIAATTFCAVGIGCIVFAVTEEASSLAGFFWALVMFALAGWQLRFGTRP
jgi:hypothetical protein